MSSRVAFREKLVSVVEALANAAVVEICRLVEDGDALLRLEVSRRQKENEELRTKLRAMELLQQQQQRADAKECGGDGRLIKQETPEGPCGGGDDATRDVGKPRTVKGLAAHVKRLPVGASHVVHEGARSEILLEAEPGARGAKEALGGAWSGGKAEGSTLHIGSLARVADDEPRAEVAGSCAHVQLELGRAAGLLPSSGASGAESDVAAGYVTRSAWSEDLGPGVARTQRGRYAEDGQRTDVPSKSGAAVRWPRAPAVSAAQSYGPDANAFLTRCRRFAAPESGKTCRRFETRGKVFVCKFCGKCCTRSSNLKRHQRVHTGEKPFSCTLCGKKFTQSCSLKRHQSVHTGARPFHCPRCRRQFSHSSDLQKHQCSHWRKTV